LFFEAEGAEMKTSIDKLLDDMSKLRGRKTGVGKGNIGEAAALQILTLHKNRIGRRCVIFQSYAYPYVPKIEGNIKLSPDGSFVHEPGKRGTDDEIDIVMLTDYRIFLIEVKAYSGNIVHFSFFVESIVLLHRSQEM
jgi:hypothetical protein